MVSFNLKYNIRNRDAEDIFIACTEDFNDFTQTINADKTDSFFHRSHHRFLVFYFMRYFVVMQDLGGCPINISP